MATPFQVPYLTLGGFMSGSLAVECYDWSALLGSQKRGNNRTLPGIPGREVRPRVIDQTRASLAYRLRGDKTYDNETASGGEEQWSVNLYGRLFDLREICDDNDTKLVTVTLTPGHVLSGACQVEEMGNPDFSTPWLATLVVDVTLPDGPIS